ncbi:hypothetical protein [Acinetobacter indicus]|uniref:hypothetical protein n=1 Tax=Acinetobacter indicus TaxID=756892 RepID=UPI00144440A1|nr:hypothetical protein [Acinetobacter indicus]
MRIAVHKNNFLFSIICSLLSAVMVGIDFVYIAIPFFLGSLCLLEAISLGYRRGGTLFHPYLFVSLILIWVLILSPIASLYYKQYLFLSPKEIDWNKWVYICFWFYFFIAILHYICGLFFLKKVSPSVVRYELKKRSALFICSLFLVFSLLCQIFVFAKFGGIMGYMTTWSEDRTEFDGLGTLLMLAEPFPILALLSLCLFVKKEDLKRPLLFIVSIFIIFFILKLLFGGFRGSRSNTIWGLFWFAGIVHLYYFKLKKSHLITGLIFLMIFMNVYSLYKSFGVDAFSMQYSLEDTGRFEDNPTITILLNDFSRIGLHSYMLYQYYDFSFYDIKFGQTYLFTLNKVLPFWSEIDLYSKNSAGSEILYDRKSSLVFQDFHNSRVYGAYGEAFLNFGPVLAVFIFGLFSTFIAFIDNLVRKFSNTDPYLFLIPFFANFSLMCLLVDSDNLLFFFFKNGFLVFLFLFSVKKFAMIRIYNS